MSGIYVHFPFCKQKCIYCNFFSVASDQLKEAYLHDLCQEIRLTKNYLPSNQIDTLYFGGGTPSLCTYDELANIINELAKNYHFSADLEFTFEANPEQLSKAYLQELLSLGVNRLSIGIQSFNDDILKILNRRHSAKTAQQAIQNAIETGFQNTSIDLIYDIAFRSEEMWRQDLQTALSFDIQHLSAYSLTVEENTLLARKIKSGLQFLPDDVNTERDFAILIEMTQKAGLRQYEISNFAQPGFESKHNCSYWKSIPYLGLGASAHSFNGNSRKWNIANLQQYIDGIQNGKLCCENEILTLANRYDEYVLLRLRTRHGIDLNEVATLFGIGQQQYILSQLNRNVNPKYYLLKDKILTLTYLGKLFADNIAMNLFWDQ